MSFLIYFDESNKLDQPNKIYSYYGAYGGDISTIYKVVKDIRKIYKFNKSKSELHFNEYKAGYISKYFQVLDYVINQDISINILVLNNNEADTVASNMKLNITELRDLFYVKIPERLFYGLTRRLESSIDDVRIKVDDNSEYVTMNVYENLLKQMNAHAVYRKKNYSVTSVKGKVSDYSIPLQIIDTFMGIVVFLMEETYYTNTVSSRSKSDLIYRFLTESDNIMKFQEKINIFMWEGNQEDMQQVPISEYISSFFAYKVQYDTQEITRLNKILHQHITSEMGFREKVKICMDYMNYSNSERPTLLGYLAEIENNDRNYFVRSTDALGGMIPEKTIKKENVHTFNKFISYSGQTFRSGFYVGDFQHIHKDKEKSKTKLTEGEFNCEYKLTREYNKFVAFIQAEEYWSNQPQSSCGSIYIKTNGKNVFDISSIATDLSEPERIDIDLNGIERFEIHVKGKMLGILDPVFIPANKAERGNSSK